MSETLQQPSVSPSVPSSGTSPDLVPVRYGLFGQTTRLVIGWLPSVLVVAALVAIAWFGHHNDWKLPKLNAATGGVEQARVPWCDSHGVPEEECIVCRPNLIESPAQLTFCREHGVHGCVLCNPTLSETKQLTPPTPSDLARAARAMALMPRKENLAISSSPGSRIQFASIAAMNKAGVDVEPVERRGIVEDVSAAGEIRYDATKTAQVSPQADGIVRRVFVEVGDWVQQGDALALIDSQDAGRLKTELLAALADQRLKQATVDRLRSLAEGAIAGKRVLESENDLQQAASVVDRTASALSNLGIRFDVTQLRTMDALVAENAVQRLGSTEVAGDVVDTDANAGNLIAVIAPLEGRIVERAVTLGQVVDRGSELFSVVDTRTMWLDLRVAAEQAPLVRIGQTVRFRPDGQSQGREGTVTWISTDVDARTRTVRIRAELANADENLRNESFGSGQIVLREEPQAIVVPESSLQWDGTGHVVFVRDARFFEKDRPKFFVTRSVRPGVMCDGFVEIIAGVLPGEVVASSGSDVLRAQLLKSNLGTGCTCGQ